MSIRQDQLKRVLGTPQGRAVLWDILSIGGVLKQPFAGEDTSLTNFNCGSLNVGIVIWAQCMEASPDLTAMMIKEQGNDRSTNPSARSVDTIVNSEPGRKPAGNNTGAIDRANAGEFDNPDPLGLGFDRSGQ